MRSRRRWGSTLVALLSVGGGSRIAAAQMLPPPILPFIDFSVLGGGQLYHVEPPLTCTISLTTCDVGLDAPVQYQFLDANTGSPFASVTLAAQMRRDRSIHFAATATNHVADPLLFSFTFVMPFSDAVNGVPVLAATSALGGAVTNNGGGVIYAGSPSFPTPGVPLMQAGFEAPDPSLQIGGTCSPGAAVGVTAPCGPYHASTSYTPAGPHTEMITILGFALSGIGDVARLEGRMDVVVTPEPTTLALLAGGGALVGLVRRRRRRSR